MEFRFWLPQQARAHYDALTDKGIAANMSADGKGVMLRWRL